MTEKYKQESIKIGEVEVPIIKEGDKLWYPIKFISEKVLLIKTNLVAYTKKALLSDNCKSLNIDYGFGTGGIQLVSCINREGWDILIANFKTGGYRLNQKQGYNNLIKYFDFNYNLLPEFDKQDIVPTEEEVKEIMESYNTYIQDCITDALKRTKSKHLKWRICSRCGRRFPLTKDFYAQDQCNNTLMHFCKECYNQKFTFKDKIVKPIKISKKVIKISKPKKVKNKVENKSKIYYKEGLENYNNIKEHNTIAIYEDWRNNGFKGSIKHIINNKEDILKIIKYLHKAGFIDKDKLSKGYLLESFNLSLDKSIQINEVYDILYGDESIFFPWKYPNRIVGHLSFNECKMIFNNYLLENDIKIDNILNADYGKLINNCGIARRINDVLGFVVEYYDYKYAGYKFKTVGQNYYKNKEHRIFDMKYLIEQDMKLDVNKIPLYVTRMTLQRNALSLYNVLYCKKYYKNLWEWIEEIYPSKFIENDFVINAYRDVFDSNDEMFVDTELHKNFTNMIYNQNNTERTIKIEGMVPDWLIFTNKNCWLVEYFGLYINREDNKNTTQVDYKIKADNKIIKYNKMKGYKSLFIYPEDLNNNFEGLHEKLKLIK